MYLITSNEDFNGVSSYWSYFYKGFFILGEKEDAKIFNSLEEAEHELREYDLIEIAHVETV